MRNLAHQCNGKTEHHEETSMPIIRVEMLKGRTNDQKRKMAQELTDAFINTAGGNAQAVQVVITDIEKEDWAAGGELMLDKYPD